LNFRRFFLYLESELEPWLYRLVFSLGLRQSDCRIDDVFHDVVERLAIFISNDAGLGSSMCTKAPFQCQHILMNLNELVGDFPTGIPKLPVVGFGGAFGAQLLQQAIFDTSNTKMVESALTELVGKYNEGSIAHLTILGLKKVEAGVCGEKQNVVVAINGRPLTTCDP
jgi:hypothetical protein